MDFIKTAQSIQSILKTLRQPETRLRKVEQMNLNDPHKAPIKPKSPENPATSKDYTLSELVNDTGNKNHIMVFMFPIKKANGQKGKKKSRRIIRKLPGKKTRSTAGCDDDDVILVEPEGNNVIDLNESEDDVIVVGPPANDVIVIDDDAEGQSSVNTDLAYFSADETIDGTNKD